MIIIYDIVKQKVIDNMGTNEKFPDGNIPCLSELPQNQIYVRVHDNSDLAKKIKSAREYDFIFDNDYNVLDINVIKTNIQAKLDYEASPEVKRHNAIRELQLLNIEIPEIVEYIIEQNSLQMPIKYTEKINRKKQLRLQLQNVT